MNINQFYCWGGKHVLTTYTVDTTDKLIGNPQVFNLAKGVYDGLVFPVKYKHQSGTKFRDMIDTGYPYLYLVSDTVIRVLEDNQITGWKTFPIIIEDKKGNITDGYRGLGIGA
jgi:hypothetical protein